MACSEPCVSRSLNDGPDRMTRTLDGDDIEALAVGAWILGTGGGGNPYPGLLNMRQAYEAGIRVRLVDIDVIDDDAQIATVASQGAPIVGQERMKDPQVIAQSVKALEDYLGASFSMLMSLEVGGGNAFFPLMAASILGYPVVDADWMGRAYPELQMTGLCVGDLRPYPLATVDPRGIEAIISKAPSWKWLEDVSRKICTSFGSTASICLPPCSGRDAKAWGIPHTISTAIRIGTAVRQARRGNHDPVEAILAETCGRLLFRGTVMDVDRKPTDGFLRGVVKIRGTEDFLSQTLAIDFQNEWLLARVDGEPAAMSPDLICVIDEVNGEAIGTETIRYGQRVVAVVLPPPEVFRSPEGLRLVGPAAFGYPIEYRSVFEP